MRAGPALATVVELRLADVFVRLQCSGGLGTGLEIRTGIYEARAVASLSSLAPDLAPDQLP
jgi:hypothetical protein